MADTLRLSKKKATFQNLWWQMSFSKLFKPLHYSFGGINQNYI